MNQMMWSQMLVMASVVALSVMPAGGQDMTAEEKENGSGKAGRIIEMREFKPEMVQQAIDGIPARQRQFYEGLAAKPRYKGVLTVLGNAMGRYGTNDSLEHANKQMLEKYPAAYADAVKNARGPWYSFVREARMYYLFSSHSAVHPRRMSPEVEKMLLDTMWAWASTTARLEFTLPERDWWSLGSENHWMHLWTGMCTTANIFAQHPDYKDRRYADGTPVPQMAKAFNDRFRRLIRDRATRGMLVECNSHYNKQTVSGMMNLADFNPDPVVRDRMRMWLDLYWADWAVEQIDGFRGGSRSRSYNDNISRTGNSMGQNAWYLFGVGEPAGTLHPDSWTTATTLYRPSPIVAELVLDVKGRGNYAIVTHRAGKRAAGTINQELHYVSEPADHILNLDKMQVLDQNNGGILRYTYATPDYVMGCAMLEPVGNDYWVNFSSQNRWDGVIFGGHTTARIYCQPEGQLQNGRGSFFNANWAVQSKGVMVIQRLRDDLSEGANNQRVWFDNSLKTAERNGWVFAESQRAYAAIKVVEGDAEWRDDVAVRPEKGDQPGPGKWLFCKSEFTPVVMEVGQKKDFGSFDDFQQQIVANPLTWSRSKLDYRSKQHGTRITFFGDWSGPPMVDGKTVDYAPRKAWDSPFIQGDFGSGVVTLSKGDKKVVLDFNKE
jgi:hypothetical protein